MKDQLSAMTRLDVQGFDGIPDQRLAPVAPWLRLTFALCATLAALGTVAASSAVLGTLVVIAALAALFPVHPFDLIYFGGLLTSVAVLVATTDICIPSMIYRAIFGQAKSASAREG